MLAVEKQVSNHVNNFIQKYKEEDKIMKGIFFVKFFGAKI